MEHVTLLRKHVGVKRACKELQVARSSYYACLRPPTPTVIRPRPRPARALSVQEQNEALELLTSEQYVDKAPASIVADLLDENRYLCCERTFYRILDRAKMVRERRDIRRHPVYSKPELMATRPNEVWTWDITKLKGPRKGVRYSLYVVIDMFSRYITGWMLASCEDDALAKRLLEQACIDQGITREQLTIHADNGGVMRSNTVSELCVKLGVTRSHSRPHCSNDNPYSESQFKTMKYMPEFPERFDSFDHAHAFCQQFIADYNYRMYHSGIAMLTPAMVHQGLASDIIEQRQRVLTLAYDDHPERFVKGVPKHPSLPDAVWINRPRKDSEVIVIS